MEKEEILKKAIEKAESNGYKFWHVDHKHIKYVQDENIFQYKKTPYNYYAGVYETIFSHSFAKAFFKADSCYCCKKPVLENNKGRGGCCGWLHADSNDEVWKYHLQQMVLESDPISYLEQFLSITNNT